MGVRRKLSTLVFAVLLCMSITAIPVFAAASSQDGLEVTLTTDKESYSSDDQIEVTLTVKNTNDFDVTQVALENVLPEGYKLAEGSDASKLVDSLKAGETVTLKAVYVSDKTVKETQPETETKAEPKDKPAPKDDNSGKKDSGPKTGDNMNVALWLAVLGISGVVIVGLIVLKKKKGKKFMAFFLCIVLAGSAVLGASTPAEAAEPETKSINVSKEISVGDSKVQLSAVVRYAINPVEDSKEAIELEFNEENLTYESENDIYFINDTSIDYLSGTIRGDISQVKSMEYTISDEKDVTIKSGTIDVADLWTIPNLALIIGSNTVCVKATLVDGTVVEKSITLWNASADYAENVEVDENDDDNDGVINYLEAYYGTDPNKADTDGDGLSDYVELYLLGTDPLLVDTDDNGISDAKEDSDGDGLTNITEIGMGTDPAVWDTDGDGLSDSDEVNVYATDPLVTDTDGDGASDGWEAERGYNPAVYNASFEAVQEQSDGNLAVSVAMELDGAQAEALTMTPVEDNPLLNENLPGYIGIAYDFSLGGSAFDTAEINFTFDEGLLADENFVPTIYYFNEDTQMLEEVATTVNGNTATATVEHFSTYILLNKTEVDKARENEADVPDTDREIKTDFVFVRDYMGELNEGDEVFDTLIQAFIDMLCEDSDSVSTDSGISDLTVVDVSEGLYKILEHLKTTDSDFKYIALVTDGGNFGTSYTCEELIALAKEANTAIYTVGIGDSSTDIFGQLSSETGGTYYHADSLEDIDAVVTLIRGEYIDHETIDYTIDSNNDGISDYYTSLLCDGTLRSGTGVPLFAGISYDEVQVNADYDGDGLTNGEEIQIVEVDGKLYAQVYSSPVLYDTDMDGYGDGVDSEPLDWNVGDRDLAIFAALAYENGTDYVNRMYQKDDIMGADDEPGETYYFLSGASLGSTDIGISQKWTIVDFVETEEWYTTHFSATTFKNGNNIVIAYRGTDAELGEWVNNVLGVGLLNYHAEESAARSYGLKIADRYPDCTIYITGHSLGGYLSQIGASEILNERSVNLEEVAYFNGIGLKYNKLLFWTKNDELNTLAAYAASHPLISYQITGDVVSALGTHSGTRVSFDACEEAKAHHAGEFGSGFWTNLFSKAAIGVFSVVVGDNLNKYYDYYGVQSVMEYFWVTHETDSFYYYLSQGSRG